MSNQNGGIVVPKLLLPEQPPMPRPVPAAWQSAPEDMQRLGFKGMLVLHVLVRKEWNEAQRNTVTQEVGNAVVQTVARLEELIG